MLPVTSMVAHGCAMLQMEEENRRDRMPE